MAEFGSLLSFDYSFLNSITKISTFNYQNYYHIMMIIGILLILEIRILYTRKPLRYILNSELKFKI